MIKPIFKLAFLIRILFICGYIMLPTVVMANETFLSGTASLGDYAQNLMEPVTILSDFMVSAAIIIGIILLFAGFIRYMQYRVNPMAYPIGSVITLIILGLASLGLIFLYKVSQAGIPPSFLKM